MTMRTRPASSWRRCSIGRRRRLLRELELLGGEIRVDRETDHGIETIRLPLPAVVTTDLRLNEPRYASLAGIMKAKKKPLDVISDAELGVAFEPRVEVIRYHSADTKRRCERVPSVDELIDRLAAKGIIA